jgi:hypothetical protein
MTNKLNPPWPPELTLQLPLHRQTPTQQPVRPQSSLSVAATAKTPVAIRFLNKQP